MTVVYGREIDGEVTTFGTTGYTFDNTFVLYDRKTESVWYPLKEGSFDAIGGSKSGSQIPFIASPPITTLAEWQSKHPDTLVLLEDAPAEEEPPTDSEDGA
jgi:Protein of unknown function (DUF3179)